MTKAAMYGAMAVLTAALATLAWIAKTSAEAERPARLDSLGGGLERAARASQGQRFVAIVREPGRPVQAAMFDGLRGPNGFEAFPPTAEPSDPLVPAMQRLADAVAEELGATGKLSQPTLRALWVFDVALVVQGDGKGSVTPRAEELDPALGAVSDVPALRVRKAAPVWLLLADGTAADPADAVEFVRTMRFGDADFIDYEDHPRRGGDVTVRVPRAASYLLTWSAEGATVEVDGEPAAFRRARIPLVVVDLPAGEHRVSVRYGDEPMGRQRLAVIAAAAAVASIVALWLGLRPHPETPPAA